MEKKQVFSAKKTYRQTDILQDKVICIMNNARHIQDTGISQSMPNALL